MHDRIARSFGWGVVIWLVAVLVILACTEFSLARFGAIGDGLAPLGSILTAGALWFAYRQHRDSQMLTHLDALADAYATWLEGARKSYARMKSQGERLAMLVRSNLVAASKEDRAEAQAILDEVFRAHRELKFLAVRILLLEHRKNERAAIDAILAPLYEVGSVYETYKDQANLSVAGWNADITKRRDMVVELIDQVTGRVQASRLNAWGEVDNNAA